MDIDGHVDVYWKFIYSNNLKINNYSFNKLII